MPGVSVLAAADERRLIENEERGPSVISSVRASRDPERGTENPIGAARFIPSPHLVIGARLPSR